MTKVMWPVVHVGQGTHVGALSVFPVWSEGPTMVGLQMGVGAAVSAAEREGHPVVGELVLGNAGAKPALLVAGELFEGGWQHRALDQDVLLLPGQQLVAGVSCVEQGRWHGHGAQVRHSRRASLSVRAAQATSSSGERQGQVWERVSRYDHAFGATATGSYVDHLDRHASAHSDSSGSQAADVGRAAKMARAVASLRPLSGQRGVLVGLGGQPAFLEVFATQAGLRRHLRGILEACVLDAALMVAEPTPGRRVRRFLSGLSGTEMRHHVGVDSGAGRALAARTPGHEIRGIAWEDRLVHATAFNRRHALVAA